MFIIHFAWHGKNQVMNSRIFPHISISILAMRKENVLHDFRLACFVHMLWRLSKNHKKKFKASLLIWFRWQIVIWRNSNTKLKWNSWTLIYLTEISIYLGRVAHNCTLYRSGRTFLRICTLCYKVISCNGIGEMWVVWFKCLTVELGSLNLLSYYC